MSDEAEILRQGDEAFTKENYTEAAELYTKLLETSPQSMDYLGKRSQTYMKLNKFIDAANDSQKAIELGRKDAETYIRKGMAHYFNGDFTNAKATFEEGIKLGESVKDFTTWLDMCSDQIQIKTTTVAKSVKIKHDWYQTESQVIVTVLIKDASPNDVNAEFEERKLLVKSKIPGASDDETYNLDICLSHNIDPKRSFFKVLKSKIEIKLQKVECVRWDKLESDGNDKGNVKQIQPTAAVVPQESSSSGRTKNWDRIANDLGNDEENAEEGAINDLFQKIYMEGSDEVKKAMNKSFMESGGTVLSTNWGEVGTQKVDVKPPDGMEFKKWDT